jgi:hypothetical protein
MSERFEKPDPPRGGAGAGGVVTVTDASGHGDRKRAHPSGPVHRWRRHLRPRAKAKAALRGEKSTRPSPAVVREVRKMEGSGGAGVAREERRGAESVARIIRKVGSLVG